MDPSIPKALIDCLDAFDPEPYAPVLRRIWIWVQAREHEQRAAERARIKRELLRYVDEAAYRRGRIDPPKVNAEFLRLEIDRILPD